MTRKSILFKRFILIWKGQRLALSRCTSVEAPMATHKLPKQNRKNPYLATGDWMTRMKVLEKASAPKYGYDVKGGAEARRRADQSSLI
jgi:hypothetical protein